MHRFQQLMVALARTEADAGLVRYAAMVARWGTARLVRFVHVPARNNDGASAPNHDELVSQMRAAVERDFQSVPNVEMAFDILDGPLTDCLLTHVAQQGIDLLLIGSQEPTGRRDLARRLAMKAPCSVWIVPHGAPDAVQRILAPIDFSEHAADAMRVAVSMARLSGQAECLALHVYFNEAVITYEEYDQVLRGQEAEAYRRFIGAVDCQDVLVQPIFEEGANVAHVVSRVAQREGADLIVMATRGRSRSAAILLGSVTEETIMDTRVPLLAVKHFGARIGVLRALLEREFMTPGLHTD